MGRALWRQMYWDEWLIVLEGLFHLWLNIAVAISYVIMAAKGLKIVTESPIPLAVATSESMEPTLHRGDILFLTNHQGTSSLSYTLLFYHHDCYNPAWR